MSFLFRTVMAAWNRTKVEGEYFDPICKRCGYKISYSKGDVECMRCTGKSNEEVLLLQAQRQNEKADLKSLGKIMIVMCFIIVISLALLGL
ncbi:hypothetical protein F0521_17160 [Ferrimonas sp. YFM]|nr:hypothetical protein F0521_17160 [Ferrimonas sp. YFM]